MTLDMLYLAFELALVAAGFAFLWHWLPRWRPRDIAGLGAAYAAVELARAWWDNWSLLYVGASVPLALFTRAFLLARRRETRQARDRHEAIP